MYSRCASLRILFGLTSIVCENSAQMTETLKCLLYNFLRCLLIALGWIVFCIIKLMRNYAYSVKRCFINNDLELIAWCNVNFEIFCTLNLESLRSNVPSVESMVAFPPFCKYHSIVVHGSIITYLFLSPSSEHQCFPVLKGKA